MSHVFISYSTHNSEYARALADKLRDEGFDVWIDNRNLHSSEDWWRSIVLALRSCAAYLVILTPEADTSRWVQREITLAEKYARPVYPLWLSGDLNTPNWEIFVRTQVEDVRGGKMPASEFYDQLAQYASRQSRKGTNIVNQMDTSVSSADVSELAEDIASPPPSPEVSTAVSNTRKIVSPGRLALSLRNWWLVAVRGAIAILLGLLVLSSPAMPLSSFIGLFGAYATVDGLITVWWSIQRRTTQGWWIHLLEGAVSVIAGIVAFVYPDNTVAVILNIIVIRGILIGIFEIWAAIQLRKEITGGVWLGLSGVSSVLFGIFGIIVGAPGAPVLGIEPPTVLGVYSISFGLFLIMLALKLRSHAISTPTKTMA